MEPSEATKSEKLQEIEAQLEARRLARYAWDQFGTRHMMLWITSVAGVLGLLRWLKAAAYASLTQQSIWEAFRTISLQEGDFGDAIAIGTIFGVGFPAAFAATRHSEFWKHPARVFFALFIGISLLMLGAETMQAGLLGPALKVQPEVLGLGIHSTLFVWLIYILFRSKIGFVWRVTLVAVLLTVLGQTVWQAWIMLLEFRTNWVQSNEMILWHSTISIVIDGVCLLLLLFACFQEYCFGNYRDWRTIILGLASFIATIAACWRLAYELLRAYQLGSFS